MNKNLRKLFREFTDIAIKAKKNNIYVLGQKIAIIFNLTVQKETIIKTLVVEI